MGHWNNAGNLYRFLLNSHMHSPLARAMYTAVKHARLNDKFQEPLYIFLELVRAGVMHGHLWSGRAFSGGPSFGTGVCFHTLAGLMSEPTLMQMMKSHACCWS